MTTELIAQARELVAKLADAVPPSQRARVLAGDIEDDRTRLLVQMADALEAAEKAHTPTDNERKAEVKSYSGWDADEVARYPRTAADVIERLRTRLLDEFRRTEVPEPSAPPRITIEHEGGNTVTGTPDDVLNHGHLMPGWRYRGMEGAR